jgi:hypothetical protein
MDFHLMAPGKGRIIGGEHSDGSVQMINDALFYDLDTPLGEFSPKSAALNEPKLQVLETCPNLIYALAHWSGVDGQKGACKDPIDCLRGLFLTSVQYIDESQYVWQGARG